MTIDSKILGPILGYRASLRLLGLKLQLQQLHLLVRSSSVQTILPLFGIYCFIGFLRRPTDILRMQSIFHFLVETVTPPCYIPLLYQNIRLNEIVIGLELRKYA